MTTLVFSCPQFASIQLTLCNWKMQRKNTYEAKPVYEDKKHKKLKIRIVSPGMCYVMQPPAVFSGPYQYSQIYQYRGLMTK